MPRPDPALVELAVALFDVARAGDVQRLADAFDAGVPVDVADGDGNTYLMLAAYHGKLASVELLIARGASVNRTNSMGQTPLAGVVYKRNMQLVSTLVAAGADPDLGRPTARETDAQY